MSDLLSELPTYDDAGRRMKVWRGQLVKADDVREALRSDETRQKITEVLAENGVQPRTDAMHSWRCDYYPDHCTCVPELVGDLIAALAGGDE